MASSSSKNPEGKADSYRRTWDKDEFEMKAKERLLLELEEESGLNSKKDAPPVKRELLKAREFSVDLDSKLGKNIIITKTTPLSEVGGYFCNVCDCVVQDSINFLDHINGRKHQRNLGMSMKVERSSLDQVKKRFEMNKRKKEEEKKKETYDFESRVKELKEEVNFSLLQSYEELGRSNIMLRAFSIKASSILFHILHSLHAFMNLKYFALQLA